MARDVLCNEMKKLVASDIVACDELEGTVKIDIFVSAKCPPAGRHTNGELNAAGRS